MLLLESIDCISSLEKNSPVHVDVIQLNQDAIFYMSVEDTIIIGIQGETQFLISCYFLNSTVMLFPLDKSLLHHLAYSTKLLLFFSLFLSFLYIISLFLFSFYFLFMLYQSPCI